MTAALSARWTPRAQVASGILMVAAYATYQTLQLADLVSTLWLVAALCLTLLSPLGGLTVLAAIGPFTESLTDAGQITAIPYLLGALGIALLTRIATSRPLPRPTWPITLAVLLFVCTALGVLNSYLQHGSSLGKQSAEMWVVSFGGSMTLLSAAAWVGWRVSTAPMFVAIASSAAAGTISLINFAGRGYLRTDTPFGWLLKEEENGNRLTGVIAGADPAGLIYMIGGVGLAAVGVLLVTRWWRPVLLLASLPALAAMYLTLTRSALLGAAVAISLIALRLNRWVGLATAALVIGGSVAAVVFGIVRPLTWASENVRIDAWASTIRLWFEHPIIGAGFRSFEWLHAQVGMEALNAPHNEWLRLFAEEGTAVGIIGLLFAVVTPAVLYLRGGSIGATAAAIAMGAFLSANFNNPFIYTQVNVALFTVIGIGLGVLQASRQPVRTSADGAQRMPMSSLDRSTRST